MKINVRSTQTTRDVSFSSSICTARVSQENKQGEKVEKRIFPSSKKSSAAEQRFKYV